MTMKQAALILGSLVAMVLFGTFAVWLFGHLGQFVPPPL